MGGIMQSCLANRFLEVLLNIINICGGYMWAFLQVMNPTAWSALISTVALILTIIFQVRNWRRDRFSRSIDIISSLDARFESADFRELRKRAATFLQSGTTDDRAGKEAIYGVLNYFETIGFISNRGAIDAEAVWNFFGSWLPQYYFAAKHLIAECQQKDPNLYIELEKIYKAICKVEAKRHPSGNALHMFSKEDIDRFLYIESAITLTARPS
jgi:hypothetical protein